MLQVAKLGKRSVAPAVVFAWEMHVYAPVYVLNVDVCYEPDIYSILCVCCACPGQG